MAINTSGKILLEPHLIVHSQVDDVVSKDEVMINYGVMKSKPIKFEKIKELGEKRSIMEQPSNLNIDNELRQKRERRWRYL